MSRIASQNDSTHSFISYSRHRFDAGIASPQFGRGEFGSDVSSLLEQLPGNTEILAMTTLYRSVGLHELALIWDSGMRQFGVTPIRETRQKCYTSVR
jgi:hypothetical protein